MHRLLTNQNVRALKKSEAAASLEVWTGTSPYWIALSVAALSILPCVFLFQNDLHGFYLGLSFLPSVLLVSFTSMGRLRLDDDALNFFKLFGVHYQLRWDEICEVETDAKKHRLLFISMNGKKRLVIPAAQSWHGKEKAALEKRFAQELQKRGLDIIETARAGYLESKGA